jgi:hypothetical protein
MLSLKKFKLKVLFAFDDITEATKVRKLLKKHNYSVEFTRCSENSNNKREQRMQRLLNKIEEKGEISAYRLYSFYYSRAGKTRGSFERDLAILILRGKVEIDNKKIVRIK